MSNVILTLGGVPFQDFEVPEKIRFGGSQRLAVHELIGGGQVVDALGEADGVIVFSGIFSGSSAPQRVQALDAARALGAAIPLIWDGFFYTVVIANFVAEYTKPWWIPFAISCAVVSDPVAELASLVSPIANIISNDILSAASLAPLAGISLSNLTTPSATGLATAQTEITSGIAASGASLNTSANAFGQAPDAATAVNALNGVTGSAGQLAALTNMNGYVNRAAANFASELT